MSRPPAHGVESTCRRNLADEQRVPAIGQVEQLAEMFSNSRIPGATGGATPTEPAHRHAIN